MNVVKLNRLNLKLNEIQNEVIGYCKQEQEEQDLIQKENQYVLDQKVLSPKIIQNF